MEAGRYQRSFHFSFCRNTSKYVRVCARTSRSGRSARTTLITSSGSSGWLCPGGHAGGSENRRYANRPSNVANRPLIRTIVPES